MAIPLDKLSLKKLLTTRDLVSLGVGSCNGTGMYVVAGLIAKRLAGPGVVISFIIAGVASLLSGTDRQYFFYWYNITLKLQL